MLSRRLEVLWALNETVVLLQRNRIDHAEAVDRNENPVDPLALGAVRWNKVGGVARTINLYWPLGERPYDHKRILALSLRLLRGRTLKQAIKKAQNPLIFYWYWLRT